MPSYWFGDVLAVVFHIQEMFAETISQPSSCFADVKLVTGGAPYAVDDIAGSAVEMIGDLGGVLWAVSISGPKNSTQITNSQSKNLYVSS